ncbi:MAG: transcriptional regulator, Fis family [Acidobacteria bacterium]|nr:transcriptional regulator, Fis family [Acidobacteriota bacterium]
MDLSARLVTAQPADIEAEITAALTSILDFFGADRCGLVAIDLERRTAHVSHAACTDGVPFVPPDLNLAPLFPWVFARILDLAANADATSVIRLEDLPADAPVDRATCAAYGVRTNLTIPIRTANRVRHLLSVHWTRDIVAADQLIARWTRSAIASTRRTPTSSSR